MVLTIAGSDPSGGAGIQADLRVFAALGLTGFSAVSVITVQNSSGVRSVYAVPPNVLEEQVAAILEDASIQAVKIGALGTRENVRAVCSILTRFPCRNVVLDPVLQPTDGGPLMTRDGARTLLSDLAPLCDVITPNRHEASVLSGIDVRDVESAARAGRMLQSGGRQYVLVKGGHLPHQPVDVLVHPGGEVTVMSGRRIDTPHTHGTGCMLSSAVAAFLAKGFPVIEAVKSARAFVAAALGSPVIYGAGRGYPNALAVRDTFLPRDAPRTHAERIARLRGIYVVTDSNLYPGRDAEQIAQAALAGGACAVQLRNKSAPVHSLVETARLINSMARRFGALFLVNDHVDLALASGADGVHLGPADMSPKDARALLGPDALVGVSVSTVEEARAAAPYASYFGVGAIFGSTTKDDAGPAVGVERIQLIRKECPQHPVVAIGGIAKTNVCAVAQAGAAAAAVVSAVVCAPDMQSATSELVSAFAAASPRG
ncbi:MAG: bifunctional hydroxymethylpyrimidine kinase/phosphomethylpyrimidine kinase [Chthonomonadales bacterium]